jgi:hypothetical protein
MLKIPPNGKHRPDTFQPMGGIVSSMKGSIPSINRGEMAEKSLTGRIPAAGSGENPEGFLTRARV